MDINILLADDHALFRDSITIWLKQLGRNILIQPAASLHDLISRLNESLNYNLILLDLYMPGMQGTRSVLEVCENDADIPVIVISGEENPLTISACLSAGAAGYIPKIYNGEMILHAVQEVLAGRRYIPPQVQDTYSSGIKFTTKQLELLALLADGYCNKEIAKRMCLSEGTVRQYVSELLHSLNVDNRTQASIKARAILGLRG